MIRSNWWIKLWPMKATMTWATTTITNATRKSSTAVLLLTTDVRVTSANVPLTLLTMNQPKLAVSQLSAAGRKFPKNPNEARPSTIWGTPKRGPIVERIACVTEPMRLPSVTPRTVGQNPPPQTAIGSTPTNTVANSIFGDIHVQKSWIGLPCRSRSGMYSTPPGSTAVTFEAYSPSRTGTCASTSVVVATVLSPFPTSRVVSFERILGG